MLRLLNSLFVSRETLSQCAALPYRGSGETLEIALVTSRGSERWIVPKGWLEPDLEPCDTAAVEAFEEAGLAGEIERQPIGFYRYTKKLHLFSSADCKVAVFPLHVSDVGSDWPESSGRRRAWFRPDDAARAVDESGLRQLIYNFAATKR